MIDGNSAEPTLGQRYRQIAAVIYIGTLITLTLDWLIGSVTSAILFRRALPTRYVLVLIVIGSLLALDYHTVRQHAFPMRRQPYLATLGLRFALLLFASLITSIFQAMFLFMILTLFARLNSSRREALLVQLALFGVVIFRLAAGPNNDLLSARDLNAIFIFLLSSTFIFMLAQLLRTQSERHLQTQQLLGDLAKSHQQLQQYANEVGELAATEERNRLARDIHDGLGHHLAATNVQLEIAIKLFDRKPAAAKAATIEAKKLAQAALQDVRKSVGTLRRTGGDAFELEPSLRLLATRMQHDGLTVRLALEGDEAAYPKTILVALYRAAQEGLTNIYKHANASHVSLWVTFSAEKARLRLIDDGDGFDPNQTTSGYGLQGMRERMRAVGGQLMIESHPNEGTVVSIEVPLPVAGSERGNSAETAPPRNHTAPIRLTNRLATQEQAIL